MSTFQKEAMSQSRVAIKKAPLEALSSWRLLLRLSVLTSAKYFPQRNSIENQQEGGHPNYPSTAFSKAFKAVNGLLHGHRQICSAPRMTPTATAIMAPILMVKRSSSDCNSIRKAEVSFCKSPFVATSSKCSRPTSTIASACSSVNPVARSLFTKAWESNTKVDMAFSLSSIGAGFQIICQSRFLQIDRANHIRALTPPKTRQFWLKRPCI